MPKHRGLVKEAREWPEPYCYQEWDGDTVRGLCGKAFKFPVLCCRERVGYPDGVPMCRDCVAASTREEVADKVEAMMLNVHQPTECDDDYDHGKFDALCAVLALLRGETT